MHVYLRIRGCMNAVEDELMWKQEAWLVSRPSKEGRKARSERGGEDRKVSNQKTQLASLPPFSLSPFLRTSAQGDGPNNHILSFSFSLFLSLSLEDPPQATFCCAPAVRIRVSRLRSTSTAVSISITGSMRAITGSMKVCLWRILSKFALERGLCKAQAVDAARARGQGLEDALSSAGA